MINNQVIFELAVHVAAQELANVPKNNRHQKPEDLAAIYAETLRIHYDLLTKAAAKII